MFSRKKFTDIKSLINLALVRLNMQRKKAIQELGVKKRVLAKHLQAGDFALARLEAERIVKMDWKIDTYNTIEIKCEEVRDNVPLLAQSKEISPDLQEAVATVIYSEVRAGIPELKEVVRILERKYGQEYIVMQRDNGAKRVDEKLVSRLSGSRPNAFLVYNYMKEIAANFGIDWVEDEVTKALGQRFDVPMSAGGASSGAASSLASAAYTITDGTILPPGQKPAGYTIPEQANFVSDAGQIEVPSATPVESATDDKDPNDSPGGGGNVTEAPPPQKLYKPTPPAVKKAVPPKTKAKPVPKAAPKEDGLADLQARFDKLQGL